MGEPGRRSARLTLPARATSPSRARRFALATLASWGLDDGEDAVLVVSELVTNGVLHARTSMTVRLVDLGGDGVRVEVADGSTVAPRERRFGPESGTGRGLRLLGRLCAEWGVDMRGGGKTVWCRVPLGARTYEEFDPAAVEAL